MSRPTARKRGYTTKWDRYRARFLRENPWCRLCLQRKKYVPATIVDHIVPHKSDKRLFWAESNHQGLCEACHNGAKKELEKSGTLRGCDESGMPLDPNHHWGQG